MALQRVGLLSMVIGVTAVAYLLVAAEPATLADESAIERTRQTVRMLDDIYKTAVVLITDKYVNSEDDFAAGSAAIALFEAIEKKGWHRVRLLDVTGQPYDSANVATDVFEKKAVEKIKNGEAYVDEVESDASGEKFLRAMTPIPVVLAKCAICHPHYRDVPAGKAIGALSYRVPIR